MLKEYLSEAVSLLTEAVLGKPIPAMAACGSGCTFSGQYCFGSCNVGCGAGKRRRDKYYDCHPGFACCPYDCVYC